MNPKPEGPHFLQLLVSLSLLLVLYPFLHSSSHARTLLNIFLTVVLFSSLYSVSENKKWFKFGVLLLVLSLAGVWGRTLAGGVSVLDAAPAAMPLFLGFLVYRILKFVLTTDEVTSETIYGASCAYLLLGLMWGTLFFVIERLHPGSIQVSTGEPLMPQCIYFSYVTLTTLGYGDVAPISVPARSFAFVEALTGQLYLAVLIARLVGLHIVHSSKN